MSPAQVLAIDADEALAARARAGDDVAMDTLLRRHRRFASTRARSYFLAGADHEDLVQEAMIGLYHAVREFDPDRQASFRTFAELCVSRQIISAVRTATRHKHGPLNNYVSWQRTVLVDGDDERTLGELLPAPATADPAEQLVCAERIRDLREHLDRTLSDLEVEVLRLHVEGVRYRDIATRLQRRAKSIDNALQRVRRKLGEHLVEREAEIA